MTTPVADLPVQPAFALTTSDVLAFGEQLTLVGQGDRGAHSWRIVVDSRPGEILEGTLDADALVWSQFVILRCVESDTEWKRYLVVPTSVLQADIEKVVHEITRTLRSIVE